MKSRANTIHHVGHTDDCGRSFCGVTSNAIYTSRDPLATAIELENKGWKLCKNCKRVIRANYGSIRRWDAEVSK